MLFWIIGSKVLHAPDKFKKAHSLTIAAKYPGDSRFVV